MYSSSVLSSSTKYFSIYQMEIKYAKYNNKDGGAVLFYYQSIYKKENFNVTKQKQPKHFTDPLYLQLVINFQN